MDVETEFAGETVTVSADGEVVGTVPREFWEEWTDRIENDPETCLSVCLSRRPAVRDA